MSTDNLEYPKAKYHATELVRVVRDADEDAELGAEWFDNPNEVHIKPEPVKRGPGRPPKITE
jgi:hypothetical protein